MKAVYQRKGETLVPVDEQGFELLHKIRDGREVMVEVKRARNPRHHRLFFAILKFMVEHTDFDGIEKAKSALKVATGEVDTYVETTTNIAYFILRSINWESKDQDEFAEFFDRAVDVITTRWMPPGTAAEDVRNEIVAMCDGPMWANIESHLRK
jgi:hypothetical protein